MALIQKARVFIRNLWVLLFACLIVEQLLYCLLIPHYWFKIIASPLFWGMVSLACFTALWRMEQRYPELLVNHEATDLEALDKFSVGMETDFYPAIDPITGAPPYHPPPNALLISDRY